MRAFIGISLPKGIMDELGKVVSQLKKTGINAKFVEPENMHFCLKFLGEVSEADAEATKTAMSAISKQFKPFDVHVKGIGVFPNERFIKVLWAGVAKGHQEMDGIATSLNNELIKAGLPKEEKGFVPHITLARVNRVPDRAALEKAMAALKEHDFGTFTVGGFSLIKSELSNTGPKYTDAFHVKLA